MLSPHKACCEVRLTGRALETPSLIAMREVALWLKVPLILLQSASLHVAMTPPTPHTKVTVEERARYTRGEEYTRLLSVAVYLGSPKLEGACSAVYCTTV